MNNPHGVHLVTNVIRTQTTPVCDIPRQIVSWEIRFDFVDHIVGSISATLYARSIPRPHKDVDGIDVDIGGTGRISTRGAASAIKGIQICCGDTRFPRS